MQTPDSASNRNPKPSFRPSIGDIIAYKLTNTKISCAVVLNIYEDIFGDRVYRIQTALHLIYLQGPSLLEQASVDTLSYFPVTTADFQSDYQECIAWYQQNYDELYQAIRPFVEDTESTLHNQVFPLDGTTIYPSRARHAFLDLGDNDPPERTFRPCVGDIIMRAQEPNQAGGVDPGQASGFARAYRA